MAWQTESPESRFELYSRFETRISRQEGHPDDHLSETKINIIKMLINFHLWIFYIRKSNIINDSGLIQTQLSYVSQILHRVGETVSSSFICCVASYSFPFLVSFPVHPTSSTHRVLSNQYFYPRKIRKIPKLQNLLVATDFTQSTRAVLCRGLWGAPQSSWTHQWVNQRLLHPQCFSGNWLTLIFLQPRLICRSFFLDQSVNSLVHETSFLDHVPSFN